MNCKPRLILNELVPNHHRVDDTLPAELQPYIHMAKKAISSGRDISLKADADAEDTPEASVPKLIKSLFRKLAAMRDPIKQRDKNTAATRLPNVIYFPYARHSSLPELRDFVGAFKARDITPCTFDADIWLQKGWSIGGLFGDCCSGQMFDYDAILDDRAEDLAIWQRDTKEQDPASQQTSDSVPHESNPLTPPAETSQVPASVSTTEADGQRRKRNYDTFKRDADPNDAPTSLEDSQSSSISDQAYETRRRAFDVVNANINGEEWGTIALISTTDNHTTLDEELGLVQESDIAN